MLVTDIYPLTRICVFLSSGKCAPASQQRSSASAEVTFLVLLISGFVAAPVILLRAEGTRRWWQGQEEGEEQEHFAPAGEHSSEGHFLLPFWLARPPQI